MSIRYYNDGTSFRLPSKGRLSDWLGRCVEGEHRKLGALNFIFCSPGRHLAINRQFLGHDYPTDVITFDYTTPQSKISGDIFIDPATVADNAATLFVAPAVEMRRVMIHGVLHLCGYGDKTRAQQKQMRAKEDFYLTKYYESI